MIAKKKKSETKPDLDNLGSSPKMERYFLFFGRIKRRNKKSGRSCFATEEQPYAVFFLKMADKFKLLLLPVLDMLFEDDKDNICGTADEMIILFGTNGASN